MHRQLSALNYKGRVPCASPLGAEFRSPRAPVNPSGKLPTMFSPAARAAVRVHGQFLTSNNMAMIVDSEDETLVDSVPLDHEMNGAAVLRPSQAVAAAEFWRRPAPRRLRRGGATADAAWKLLWSKRPARRTIAELCGARGTPLLWTGRLRRLGATMPSAAPVRRQTLAARRPWRVAKV